MVLKNTCIWFFCPMSKWAGAFNTLIPWLCISTQSCSWLQIYVDYCLDADGIFPVVSGEIIYRKIRFPGNFKFSPTLGKSCKVINFRFQRKQKRGFNIYFFLFKIYMGHPEIFVPKLCGLKNISAENKICVKKSVGSMVPQAQFLVPTWFLKLCGKFV